MQKKNIKEKLESRHTVYYYVLSSREKTIGQEKFQFSTRLLRILYQAWKFNLKICMSVKNIKTFYYVT